MTVRYEERRGAVIFREGIADEFIYQSVAENLIQIGHVLESSRKFGRQGIMQDIFLKDKERLKGIVGFKFACLRSNLLVSAVLGRSSDE